MRNLTVCPAVPRGGIPACLDGDRFIGVQASRLFCADKARHDAVLSLIKRECPHKDKAYLGVFCRENWKKSTRDFLPKLANLPPGVYVTAVMPETGLYPLDRILRIDGRDILVGKDVPAAIEGRKPGDVVDIKRVSLGAKTPEVIRYALAGRDTMYELMLSANPLDAFAELADQKAHEGLFGDYWGW